MAYSVDLLLQVIVEYESSVCLSCVTGCFVSSEVNLQIRQYYKQKIILCLMANNVMVKLSECKSQSRRDNDS